MQYLFLLSILLAGGVSASEAQRIRDYPLDRIAPATYVVHGPLGVPSVENQGFMNNPGFIVTETGVVVIDPGSSVQAGRMVVDKVRSVTDKPVTHVFATHVHGDHWLGNQAIQEAWPKAAFYAHPAMIERAHAGAADNWLRTMERLSGGFTKGTVALIPDNVVNEGDAMEIGGITFRFYAPELAHSGTDVMIEVEGESVLFLGDNVTYNRIPRTADGTFRGNIAACDVAAAIDAAHFVPGHGPTGPVERVQTYRQYLSTLYNEVKRLYEEEDLTDYEMKPLVMEKLGAFSEWANFDDEVGKQVSQALLEVENEDF